MVHVRRLVVVALCMAGAFQASAQAQSRWGVEIPAMIALAKDGVVAIVAPPSFTGCTQGEVLVESSLTVLPGLDLWSPVAVLDEGAPTWHMRWVYPGSGALNIKWQSNAWIRVLPFAGDADLLSFFADPCGFYHRPPLAEGPGWISYTSADDALTGPGTNSWGFTIHGPSLLTTLCSTGAVRLSWVQRWIIKSDTDFAAARLTVEKGPLFTCR